MTRCALLAWVLGSASLAQGSSPTWALDTPTPRILGPQFHAIPLAEGGALIGHSVQSLGVVTWHLDAELGLRPLGLYPEIEAWAGEQQTSSGPVVLAQSSAYATTFIPDGCERRSGVVLGRDLQMLRGVGSELRDGLPWLTSDGRFGFVWRRISNSSTAPYALERPDHDCSTKNVDFEASHVWALRNMPDGEGALMVAVRIWEQGGESEVHLARVETGETLWHQPLQTAEGVPASFQGLRGLGDSDILLWLRSQASDEPQRYFLQRWSADGVMQSQREVDPPSPEGSAYHHELIELGDQTIVVYATGSNWAPWERPLPSVLRVLDAQGNVGPDQALGFLYERLPQTSLRREQVLLQREGAVLGFDEQHRLYTVSDTSGFKALAELSDGRLLLQHETTRELHVRDPQTAADHHVNGLTDAFSTGPSGLVHGDEQGVVEAINLAIPDGWVRGVDADGTELWRFTSDDAEAAFGGPLERQHRLVVDAERVCVMLADVSVMRLICLARDSGELVWRSVPVPAQADWYQSKVWLRSGDPWFLRFDRTSRLLMAQPLPQQGAAGQERALTQLPFYLSNLSSPPVLFFPLDAEHLVVIGHEFGTYHVRVSVANRDGGLVRNLAVLWPVTGTLMHPAPNGFLLASAVRQSGATDTLELLRIDLDQSVLWQRQIDGVPDYSSGAPGADQIIARPGAWHIWHSAQDGFRIRTLDDDTGALRWERHIEQAPGRVWGCLLPNRSGPLGILERRRENLELSWLSPEDGSGVNVSQIDDAGLVRCRTHGGGEGTSAAFAVGDTGAAINVVNANGNQTLRIDPPEPAGAVPDIGWLRGVWYDPAASGQGLVLEFYPGQNLLSGAWFTFSERGGHARSEQRWFTLQASTDAGASVVEGTIRSSQDGRFAQPPAVPGEPVGSVTLRMLDCDQAILDYQFDGQDAASGRILLRRLIAESGCSAYGGPLASSGARFWYDPATSGQGLYLQSVGDAQFGAWFTFDPEGLADDPTSQHWFILAGQGADTSGVQSARILRHIGGSFNNQPTQNTADVGRAVLRPLGCAQTRLEYEFDRAPWAAEFLGMSGSMDLQRIGGCTD